MNNILGLIAMTSPLFLIVLWVPVCIALVVLVGRKFIRAGFLIKIAISSVIFLVLLILPVADEIAGRIYFNHLCETEAGVKVYQIIELPAEYWNEDGSPKFYDDSNANFTLPVNHFEWESRKEKYLFHVERNDYLMKEQATGIELNERTLFRYWGGWISRNLSSHNTAVSCGSDLVSYSNYVSQIFKPEKLNQKGDKLTFPRFNGHRVKLQV